MTSKFVKIVPLVHRSPEWHSLSPPRVSTTCGSCLDCSTQIGAKAATPNYAATRSKLAKKIGLGRKTGTKMKARRKA